MTSNMQMEQLSLAYIRAVAADAGCQVTRPDPDIDSVDGVLMASFGRRPRIEFQAKATTQDVLSGDSIHFPLPVKNYDDLRAETRTPRILIVMLMPSDDTDRLTQNDYELSLRHCAYWQFLEGREPTRNTSSITIAIPTTNIFSVERLTDLMERAERGDPLC